MGTVEELEALHQLTTNSCPPWCDLDPGHAYESTGSERVFRFHSAHQMRLSLAAGKAVDVLITCEESADFADQDVQLAAPTIDLWAAEGQKVTVHEALSLSDMLARAAVELAKITGERLPEDVR